MAAKTIRPETIGKAITLLASGQNQVETAKALGISQTSVHTAAKRHKDDITALAVSLISASLKPVLQNHTDLLSLSHQLLQIAQGKKATKPMFALLARVHMMGLEPKDIISLADKKEERFMKMVGILPSHTQSIVINQLFQDNRLQVASPEAVAMVTSQLDSRDALDVDLGIEDVGDVVDIDPDSDG